MKTKIASILIFLCIMATSAIAQVKVGESGKISGRGFGDYYWIPVNHNSNLKGDNGFWIRRIYFTYDNKLSDSFSARFRLEMNSKGDFKSNEKLYPHLKDAYVAWNSGHQHVLAGISPTPTYTFVRSVWGYRSVEKSPLNLQKMAAARNLGLALKGKIGSHQRWNYFFMVSNGSGNKTELNKGKKFMLSLSYRLTKHLTIQAYGGWNDKPGRRDRYTTQGFLAYQTKKIHIGALYAHQTQREALPGQQDLDLNIASLFTNFKVTKKVKGLLRVDHLFEANPVGEHIAYIPFSNSAESTLFIAGADMALDPSVHLIPNVETVVYGQTPAGDNPATDFVPRLTLYYTF